ncbi:PEP-CTERM sorting domain-containing protein [Parasphingorhabdus sp. DH2-15]|uniref:PEP-CTERM sorting domain-containing protein n=1 Tax=Parasphingorhabdus sp. DH2-15 TaxID=3444112 RepID=UPI003F688CE2
MKKIAITLAAAASTVAIATPASADLFTYTQTNGDILTVDTHNNRGSLVGRNINATFTGDFSGFTGGAAPTGRFALDSVSGTRQFGSISAAPNANRQQFLIFGQRGDPTRTNLWTSWGNPVIGGDYISFIGGFSQSPSTPVPAPGMLGLFGLGLAGLGFAHGRRKFKARKAAA